MGTGVVIAPGLLADASMWLEWWRAGPGDTPSALKLDLDPTSLGFYDYTQAAWYVAPSGGSSGAVVGPFVDFGGTNEYTLAVTVPVILRESFLGVAGADLWATRLEAAARRLMRGLGRNVVLVNSDDRVLASRSPRLVMGALVREMEGAVRYRVPASRGQWSRWADPPNSGSTRIGRAVRPTASPGLWRDSDWMQIAEAAVRRRGRRKGDPSLMFSAG